MGQFRHNHSGKTSTPAVFLLRTSYHVQRYMERYCANRSLLTQSFNIVNTSYIVILKKVGPRFNCRGQYNE